MSSECGFQRLQGQGYQRCPGSGDDRCRHRHGWRHRRGDRDSGCRPSEEPCDRRSHLVAPSRANIHQNAVFALTLKSLFPRYPRPRHHGSLVRCARRQWRYRNRDLNALRFCASRARNRRWRPGRRFCLPARWTRPKTIDQIAAGKPPIICDLAASHLAGAFQSKADPRRSSEDEPLIQTTSAT